MIQGLDRYRCVREAPPVSPLHTHALLKGTPPHSSPPTAAPAALQPPHDDILASGLSPLLSSPREELFAEAPIWGLGALHTSV